MMITPGRNETKNEKNGQEVKKASSGDRKPRFKWTVQIHERFVDVVNQLGGIYKATPKYIMKMMDIEQITTDHIKSHLQKYRLNGSKQANTKTRKSKKCFHEFFCDKSNSISTTSRTQVQHNTWSAYNGVREVPEIPTERQRASQTKLEFERVQQQVQYIERGYHGALEKTSNNEEIQYSTLEIERKNLLKLPYKRWLEAQKERGKFAYTSTRTGDRELLIPEQKMFDAAPVRISLQMEKGSSSNRFSADGTKERGKFYQVYASPTYAAQLEAQNMVVEHNKTNTSYFPCYKDLKTRNASNERPFDLNMPAKEQEE